MSRYFILRQMSIDFDKLLTARKPETAKQMGSKVAICRKDDLRNVKASGTYLLKRFFPSGPP
jgi:hypothetical protein